MRSRFLRQPLRLTNQAPNPPSLSDEVQRLAEKASQSALAMNAAAVNSTLSPEQAQRRRDPANSAMNPERDRVAANRLAKDAKDAGDATVKLVVLAQTRSDSAKRNGRAQRELLAQNGWSR